MYWIIATPIACIVTGIVTSFLGFRGGFRAGVEWVANQHLQDMISKLPPEQVIVIKPEKDGE